MCFANTSRQINRNAPQRLQVKAASGKDSVFTNFRSETSAHRHMCIGKGEGLIYREIGLKVSVMLTIRETFNWLCCDFDEGQGEGG